MRSSLLLVISSLIAVSWANPAPLPAASPAASPCYYHSILGQPHPAGFPERSSWATRTPGHAVDNHSGLEELRNQGIIRHRPIRKKDIPKVKNPSRAEVVKAAKSAGARIRPNRCQGSCATKYAAALESAIAARLAQATPVVQVVTVTQATTQMSTLTVTQPTLITIAGVTSTISLTGAEKTMVVSVPVTQTVVATQTVTADSAAGSALKNAAVDIKGAIEDALKAVNLAQTDLTEQETEALEKCLAAVVKAGGVPKDYACTTANGADADGLQSTLNNILEQFVGILPNIILEKTFNAIMPTLTDLLPESSEALVGQITSSIKSVIATLSGNSVTAMNQLQSCYTEAVRTGGNASSLNCYVSSGAQQSLDTAMTGVLEQFVGVLPASLVTSVQNIFTYNAANTTDPESLAGKVQAQISNAINSVGSTLSGNTVSLALTLQGCTSILIKTGDAKAAEDCIVKGQAPVISSTMIRGIAEQFSGYLPSSYFSNLMDAAKPLLNNVESNPNGTSHAEVAAALEKIFNNMQGYGPSFVTCIHKVQDCVLDAVRESGIRAVCDGPVGDCRQMEAPKKYRMI